VNSIVLAATSGVRGYRHAACQLRLAILILSSPTGQNDDLVQAIAWLQFAREASRSSGIPRPRVGNFDGSSTRMGWFAQKGISSESETS
jgi:hypothetical protein